MQLGRTSFLVAFLGLALAACGGDDSADASGAGGDGVQITGAGGTSSHGAGPGGSGTTSVGGGGAGGAGATGGGGNRECPASMTCVDSFPFHDERDTSKEGSKLIDVYQCKATANESGPEIYYRIALEDSGTLTATVTDGDGVDIDVHILTSVEDVACIARDDVTATAMVDPPFVYVVADTYVSGGVPQAGPYQLDITFQ